MVVLTSTPKALQKQSSIFGHKTPLGWTYTVIMTMFLRLSFFTSLKQCCNAAVIQLCSYDYDAKKG